MQIFKTFSGDYRVVQEYPFTPGDIMSVAHKVARESDDILFDWPVLTDDTDDAGNWQIWFINPEGDDSYLDHEELV